MRRAAALLVLSAWVAAGISPVLADGTLPPQPYRYLHPPPALVRGNLPPLSGKRVLPTGYERSAHWFTFTQDGQAGLSAPNGAFTLPPSASGVLINIVPVEAPSGLPSQVAVDGNAYRFMAVAQPGNRAVSLARKVQITLHWPHIPTAIYLYTNGSWRQLCYSDTAILTPSTVSCPTKSLGIVAAVASPAVVGRTTSSSSTSNTIIHYLPVIAIVVVVLLAVVLGFLVTRPRGDTPRRT